jgi:lysophospholipase L1-like esterase
MKKLNLLVLIAGACVCLASFTAGAVNIMPMGDSVTARGGSPESSYRYWLYTYLINAGYQNINFVGNQNGVSDGPPENSNFDQHYEGGATPGPDAWTSQDGVDAISNANSHSPDIVLLDLGSNDFNSGDDMTAVLATIKVNLEQIIEGLRAANSGVIILLAEPTPWVTSAKDEKKFQSALKGLVSQVAKEEGVIKVNLFGGFSAKNDTKDGTHPNVRGEQKIAKKYFSALKKVL